MAINESRKVDFVWKKIKGRVFTDNFPSSSGKAYYEEFPGVLVNPHASEIWASEIPIPAPSNDTQTVKVYTDLVLTEDNSVVNHRSWLACETQGDPTTRLTGWIPPRFDQSYTVRIYDNNGTEITTTHESNWFFDYENGILVFENDPTQYGLSLPIHLKGFRYVGETLSGLHGEILQNTYEVTNPYQENESIDITTGNGANSGTSNIIRISPILTLGDSESDFLNNNNIQIYMNGVKLEKTLEVTYIDATHFSIKLPLDKGDIFEIQEI